MPTNDVIGVNAFHKKNNSIKKQVSLVPTILLLICLGLDLSNRVFSDNVTTAMLVSQTVPVGLNSFLMQTLSFVLKNLHR